MHSAKDSHFSYSTDSKKVKKEKLKKSDEHYGMNSEMLKSMLD